MIQFNLLPDVKLEYIKARRIKRLVMISSSLVTIIALVILIFLIVITSFLQKHQLSNLDKDIKSNSNKLHGIKDLDKILTIQNQLNSLPDLHSKKIISSKLFSYLSQVTPVKASISKLHVDFTSSNNNMIITGNTDSLVTVNQFVDTLKFTTYISDGQPTSKNAFTNVVLGAFARDSKSTSYTINLNFDPLIFSATNNVSLTVPSQITTRSETDKPTQLFQTPVVDNGNKQGN
ncbi:MAG: hypothetical protein NVSMB46_00890 [Candidatus Saccharimonadales bacterium]